MPGGVKVLWTLSAAAPAQQVSRQALSAECLFPCRVSVPRSRQAPACGRMCSDAAMPRRIVMLVLMEAGNAAAALQYSLSLPSAGGFCCLCAAQACVAVSSQLCDAGRPDPAPTLCFAGGAHRLLSDSAQQGAGHRGQVPWGTSRVLEPFRPSWRCRGHRLMPQTGSSGSARRLRASSCRRRSPSLQ